MGEEEEEGEEEDREKQLHLSIQHPHLRSLSQFSNIFVEIWKVDFLTHAKVFKKTFFSSYII